MPVPNCRSGMPSLFDSTGVDPVLLKGLSVAFFYFIVLLGVACTLGFRIASGGLLSKRSSSEDTLGCGLK